MTQTDIIALIERGHTLGRCDNPLDAILRAIGRDPEDDCELEDTLALMKHTGKSLGWLLGLRHGWEGIHRDVEMYVFHKDMMHDYRQGKQLGTILRKRSLEKAIGGKA